MTPLGFGLQSHQFQAQQAGSRPVSFLEEGPQSKAVSAGETGSQTQRGKGVGSTVAGGQDSTAL